MKNLSSHNIYLSAALFIFSFFSPSSLAGQNNLASQNTLLIQITIDQLRADFFDLQAERQLKDGGLKFLLDNGYYYENAQYQHANTFTAVGHATLATGVSPATHGIIDNQWYDAKTNKVTYCTDDPDAYLLPDLKINAGSAKRLLHSTLADQVIANGGQVYAISVKDRGAIYLAGKNGKALWYNKNNGEFTSSSFYFKQLPDWVEQFNQKKIADNYLAKSWELSYPAEDYLAKVDARHYENTPKGFDNQFPHVLQSKATKAFYKTLTATPFADEMTLQLAKHIISTQKLGQNQTTDFLSISLSANDYIGHNFGAFSLEAEDQKVKLDKMLGDFIRFVEQTVGLDKVVFALSSDHGVAPSAEYRHEHQQDGARIKESLLLAELNDLIKKEMNWDFDPIANAVLPFIHVAQAAYSASKLSKSDLDNKLASIIATHQNIVFALPQQSLKQNTDLFPANNNIEQRLANSVYPSRSGDIIIAAKPYLNYSWDQSKYISIHGTPHQYDTHVPLLISKAGLKGQRISDLAAPKQLAPSLAKLANFTWLEHQNSELLSGLEQFIKEQSFQNNEKK